MTLIQGDWKVEPIPEIMLDRRVDVGDVSPDDAKALVDALNCGAQVRGGEGESLYVC